jgi:acyl carrier protein
MRSEPVSFSNETYARVTSVLAEALNADEHEITPAAILHSDLGAESIDLLDIIFRLEREFGVHIQRNELFPSSIFQNNPAFVADGKVTDMGLAELRSQLPYADLSHFEGDRRLSAVPDLFTVDLVTRFVNWKLSRNIAMTGTEAQPVQSESPATGFGGQEPSLQRSDTIGCLSSGRINDHD